MKPSSPVSQATFSGLPALPITEPAPRSRANWPTRLPTAPAAPETKTSSPGANSATRNSPAYAVSPGMPRTPRWWVGETPSELGQHPDLGGRGRSATSRHAASASTSAPTGTASDRDSTTRPTAPPCITSPTSQGGA